MPAKKVNFYISYIKGAALIGIVLIHLIDWSNMQLPFVARLIKESFYAGVLLFVLAAGSTIFIAYGERPSFAKSATRLFYRGAQLLFFYYLYSVIKLFIFNFKTEPFYAQFINAGTLTVPNILMFRSFSVPITILIMFAFFLALSSLFLYINKKTFHPKRNIALFIAGLLVINYATSISSVNSPIIEFLYARGYVLFSLALWLAPFLIGFFLAQVGFEKHKKSLLITSGALTLAYGVSFYFQHKSLFPSNYEFPLSPYFMVFSLFIMSLALYAFYYLERMHRTWIKKSLAILRLLGDNSLYLYLYHWIVIDLTIWLFVPRVSLIWLTIPLFLTAYLFMQKKKLVEYYAHQESAAKN